MNNLILQSKDANKKYQISVTNEGILTTTEVNENASAFSAQSIINMLNDDVYYDEITYEELRDDLTGTDYYITYIPNKDKEGNVIKLKHGYANDTYNYKDENGEPGETARSFSIRHCASFATNASIWDYTNWNMKGVQIQDGVILNDVKNIKEDDGYSQYNYTLGITDDNTLKVYHYTVPASTIMADGCVNAFTAFYPIIINGLEVDFGIYQNLENTGLPNPRNVIAQLPNKDIIFLSCDARDLNNQGLTYADLIRILKSRGAVTAYNLDGGGSTQAFVRGQRLNKPIDDWGKTERKVGDFIYVEKDSSFKQNIKTLGEDVSNLNKKLQKTQLDLYQATDLFGLFYKKAEQCENANIITNSGVYYITSSNIGSPTTTSNWAIFHIQIGNGTAIQFAVPYAITGNMMMRRTSGTSWTTWREL